MTPRAAAKKAKNLKRQIAAWEQAIALASPAFLQVQVLVRKFGGIIPFAIAAGEHPKEIIAHWIAKPERRASQTEQHQRSPFRNHDGLLPLRNLTRLLQYARYNGILLDAKDIYPELFEASDLPQTPERLKKWAQNLPKSKKMQDFEHVLASLVSIRV